jgi:oligopeptide transport system substrate-binding protein
MSRENELRRIVTRRAFVGLALGGVGGAVAGCAAPGARRPGEAAVSNSTATGESTTDSPSTPVSLAVPDGTLVERRLRDDQNLRLAMEEPSLAGPGPGLDTGLQFLVHLGFNGLYGLDARRTPIPNDAESYSPSSDLKSHRFTLRKGLTWSDGVALTAQDYEWSFKTMATLFGLTPDGVIVGARELNDGTAVADALGFTALDDLTFEIVTTDPCSYMLEMLAGRTWARPVPRHLLEAHGEAWAQLPHWAGNGPFKLVEWNRASTMVLERRDEFIGGPMPTINRIELTLVDSAASETSYRAFQAGDLDYAVVPLEEVDVARSTLGSKRLREVPYPFSTMIVLNATRPALADVRVRQALYLAIDREALVTLSRGLGRPAYSLLAPEMRDGYPGEQRPDFATVDDLIDTAQRLLAAAGFPNGDGFPTLEYLALAGAGGAPQVEAIQAMWSENLGVTIEIRPLDVASWFGAVFSSDQTGWGDMADASWPSDYPDPAEILEPLLVNGGQFYHHNVDYGPDFVGSLRSALSSATGRSDELARFDLRVMEQVPLIPLAFGSQLAAVQPGIDAEFFYYGADFQRVRFAQLFEAG